MFKKKIIKNPVNNTLEVETYKVWDSPIRRIGGRSFCRYSPLVLSTYCPQEKLDYTLGIRLCLKRK